MAVITSVIKNKTSLIITVRFLIEDLLTDDIIYNL